MYFWLNKCINAALVRIKDFSKTLNNLTTLKLLNIIYMRIIYSVTVNRKKQTNKQTIDQSSFFPSTLSWYFLDSIVQG